MPTPQKRRRLYNSVPQYAQSSPMTPEQKCEDASHAFAVISDWIALCGIGDGERGLVMRCLAAPTDVRTPTGIRAMLP